jgi:Fe2+ transport system protein FeoA
MNIPLIESPPDRTLVLKAFTDPDLAERLGRMGLFEGSEIERLDQEVLVQPVRVKGPAGEAVLGGGMAMKVVIHLDDGRKLPLAEMKTGETGHMEGVTGGPALSDTLAVLGLSSGDSIRFLRHLPPMTYITRLETGVRIHLTEGMAAKLWGRSEEESMQFVCAPTGKYFKVLQVLGGERARQMLYSRQITPETVLVLENVAPAQSLRTETRNPVVIASREGLRLFLSQEDGRRILVAPAP